MTIDSNTTSSADIRGKHILITGATGLVGSHLMKALLQQGKKVKALYRKDIPFTEHGDNIEWIQGDILDVVSIESALLDVDEVYHCAAVVSFHNSSTQEMFKVNVEGTANVVDACLNGRVRKLCYVSSVAAIGKVSEGLEVTEDAIWTEKSSGSNYSKSKYLAEMEVWRGSGEGLDAVMVNPSIILGAGDWSKGSSGIFKTAYDEFPWYTEGVTGFVDVMDVVKAMISLMDSNVSGERFILSAENRKFKEIFTAIAEGFGKKPPTKKVNTLLAEVVWRLEAVKSMVTGGKPLLTKETALAAQSVVKFNNTKVKRFLPSFEYTPLSETISRVCRELKKINNLP